MTLTFEHDIAKRATHNPILTPDDIKPSDERFHVDCVLNAGVAKYNGEVILLVRVAERLKDELGEPGHLTVPLLDADGKLTLRTFDKRDDQYDYSDSRTIINPKTKKVEYLTAMSHIRIARSQDGVHFSVDETPFIFPSEYYEAFGCEDPRITQIGDTYYINYTGVSKHGITTVLAKTTDFQTVEKMGMIFVAENRDVCIFPEKINGLYYAMHRPVPEMIGRPEIWMATSPDLMHWGNHQFIAGVTDGGWEAGRIGGGAVPFKTKHGWIAIYHAADANSSYQLGAMLFDLNDPFRVLAKTDQPIMGPSEDYEQTGYFGNVVFTCGVEFKESEQKIDVYYGAADTVVCKAELTLDHILTRLGIQLNQGGNEHE